MRLSPFSAGADRGFCSGVLLSVSLVAHLASPVLQAGNPNSGCIDEFGLRCR